MITNRKMKREGTERGINKAGNSTLIVLVEAKLDIIHCLSDKTMRSSSSDLTAKSKEYHISITTCKNCEPRIGHTLMEDTSLELPVEVNICPGIENGFVQKN